MRKSNTLGLRNLIDPKPLLTRTSKTNGISTYPKLCYPQIKWLIPCDLKKTSLNTWNNNIFTHVDALTRQAPFITPMHLQNGPSAPKLPRRPIPEAYRNNTTAIKRLQNATWNPNTAYPHHAQGPGSKPQGPCGGIGGSAINKLMNWSINQFIN